MTTGEMRVALGDDGDEGLLRRAAKGDEESFVALYGRHQAALFRYALRMTGSAWAAEEIVQDVFMILMREPKKYEAGRGAVGAFLFGIARNRVMKHLERLPREVSFDAASANGDAGNGTGGGPRAFASAAMNKAAVAAAAAMRAGAINTFTPAHWVEQQERVERVRAAVLELPAEYREAVVLCELEELSYEEAARVAGCPIGTIRSRLHRGRALLLAKLEMLRDEPRRCGAAS